jgi:hypothetical protein
MVIDIWKKKTPKINPIFIRGEPIELDMTITNTLASPSARTLHGKNTLMSQGKIKIMKKMHYLKLLKKFGVSSMILKTYTKRIS